MAMIFIHVCLLLVIYLTSPQHIAWPGNTSILTPWNIKDNARNLPVHPGTHQFLYALNLPMSND